jgi:hypothetical protein
MTNARTVARGINEAGPVSTTIVRSEGHPRRKLDTQHVERIRTLHGIETSYAVARQFGVNATTVQRIWRGENWQRVEAANG